MTTAFPIAEAIPKLQPGVYVLAAYAADQEGGRRLPQAATQWFIVSDLGLTAINGDDGMHAFVRSLATATPVVNANVRLIARNNEVLGTAKTDSRGYARFDAGLQARRGRAGAGRAGRRDARRRLRLPRSGHRRLRPDRPRRQGPQSSRARSTPSPTPTAASIAPGEDVHLTTLARDRTGKASAVPVTVIFSRPDGVEHSRIALTDQGLGGRATSWRSPARP